MTSSAPLTLRRSTAADAAELERLAALDSTALLDGTYLIAERCDQPVAAVHGETGTVIADPFEFTAETVELLRRWRGQTTSASRWAAMTSPMMSSRRRRGSQPVRSRILPVSGTRRSMSS